MLELYQNIKARRIELGLSQTQLAELTGYADKSAISKIEKGMRDIPQSKLMAFAVAQNKVLEYVADIIASGRYSI